LFIFANHNFLNYAFIVDPNIGEIKSYPKTKYPVNIDSLKLNYKFLSGYAEIQQKPIFYKPPGGEFIAVNRGIATSDCYEQIPTERFAADFDSASYLGYAHKNGKAQTVEDWSPQKMTISLSEKGEEILIINQSYDPGWHAKTESGEPRELLSEGHLIGIKTLSGDSKITLDYNPF